MIKSLQAEIRVGPGLLERAAFYAYQYLIFLIKTLKAS
jgi:hypothetical protein